MWGRTCIPSTGYQVLYPFKRHFRCAQAQHFLVFCWLVTALMRDPGQGTLKGLRPYLPATLPYWTTVRRLRTEQWEAQAVVADMAAAPLRALPPPSDGVLSLLGESPLQAQRGRQHPLGQTTRHRAHAPDPFGVELVLRMARGERLRVPVALGLLAPQRRGHQNILCRQMLQTFVPPAGARQVGGVADAGFAANETLRVLAKIRYSYVRLMVQVLTLVANSSWSPPTDF